MLLGAGGEGLGTVSNLVLRLGFEVASSLGYGEWVGLSDGDFAKGINLLNQLNHASLARLCVADLLQIDYWQYYTMI